MAAPLQTSELQEIANNACNQILGETKKYDHASVAGWNTEIINTILQSLISKTAPTPTSSDDEPKSASHKYIVNSTIIQHHGGKPTEASGRRGMHSAIGAYWNNEKDGTWSWKWDGAEEKGMDVVLTVTWVSI
ncbi:hypothetical protein M011DRAFT_469265 [Sporormia fimetaria CBS 119925]|uniref:Tctex-1 n=1 Tax=Sporormia fimetaria CBS 119925 TaxID=1340428 RepID=A0A6A6V4V9_9PLEO|nr:hypothetical protein M011DRAFT_469265 [Sporormia fimetaria CBS 119925]